MRLSLEEFRQLQQRRPELFGPVDTLRSSKQRKQKGALGEKVSKAQSAPRGNPTGLRVRCTLIAAVPRRLDGDNLGTALKAVRDAIADALGVDDGDPSCAWEYGQVETRGESGVVVKLEIERKTA